MGKTAATLGGGSVHLPPSGTNAQEVARMDSTTKRGYGAAHQRERARLEPIVRAGGINCYRCNDPIQPDGPWDLGHNDDRTAWTGPEHVKCNRAAGGANGAAVTNQKKQTISRDW